MHDATIDTICTVVLSPNTQEPGPFLAQLFNYKSVIINHFQAIAHLGPTLLIQKELMHFNANPDKESGSQY